MVRELPLLLGSIGTVLGFFTLPWVLFLLAMGYASHTDFPLGAPSLSDELLPLAWEVSPFFGLAGAFNVKKRGKLGGSLFMAAGSLPWFGSLLSSGVVNFGVLIFFFWTPPLVIAGILAIFNWPGPYVDKEELDEMAEESSS